MKITINTLGTRGDVQPFIALGIELKQSGHTVKIVSHQIFEKLINDHNLDYHPISLDPRQVMINQALADLGNNTVRITRWIKENFKPVLREIFIETLKANRNTDLMLNSGLSFAGWHIAEKFNIPSVACFLWPMTPSRHLMGAIGKNPPNWLPFRGTFNFFTTKLFNQLFYNMLAPSVNECRKEILDLQPLKAGDYWGMDSPQSLTPIIYAYSPVVVPKPSDWGQNQKISGYWFLNERGYQPPKELTDFLAEGSPPVCIGFGSMIDQEQQRVTKMVINALQETNCRGIILGGWSRLGSGELPKSIIRMDSIPHDWLFSQMKAVVHHGGAGTTAAGLRAGIPNVIVPSFGDQFFWGWRVYELGAGPKPIPRKKLTVSNLAQAVLMATSNDAIRTTAIGLSQRINTELGTTNAVKMIQSFVNEGHL